MGEEPLSLVPLPEEIPKPVHTPLIPKVQVMDFERPAGRGRTVQNPLAFNQGGGYAGASKNLAAFFSRVGSPLTRDKAYDKASNEILKAVSKDLGARRENITGTAETAINSFILRQRLSNGINSVADEKDALNKKLESIMLGGGLGFEGVDAQGNPIVPQSLVELHEQMAKLQRETATLKTLLADQTTKDILISRYGKNWVDALESQVNTISGVTTSQLFLDMMSGKVDRKGAGIIIQQLARTQGVKGVILGRDLTGGDIFCPSFERQLNRDLLEELEDDNSEVNRFITSTDSEANKLMYFLPSFLYEQDSETFTEFAQKLQTGFAERYIWTQRFGKFTYTGFHFYTPRDIYKWALNKVQNFGMVLDEESLKKTKWYKRAVELGTAPTGIFANRFNVSFKDRNGNPFQFESENGGKVNVGKIKTWGGEHFSAVSQINGGFIKGEDLMQNSTFVRLFLIEGKKLSDFGVWKDGKFIITSQGLDEDVLNLLNLIAGNKNLNQEKIQNYFRNVEKFREFVNKNILEKLGIKNTEEFWKKLMAGLKNVKLTKITRRYMGLMERASMLVRRIQENLYEKNPVAKFVFDRVFLIKRAIKNVAAAVRKAINRFFKDVIAKRILAFAEKLALKSALHSVAQALGTAIPIIGNLIALLS